MLGRFHEIAIATRDIRASVEFYERLGFVHAQTGDTWPHPYGVLTDGRIHLGLHQGEFESPQLRFVHPDIAAHAPALEALGIELTFRYTSEDVFNHVGFRDPAGHLVAVLEARTYSPVERRPDGDSLCGYFSEYSMPATDFAAARTFWEALGFVATDESEEPYLRLPLVSDYIDLAFHRPRTQDRPMLIFSDPDMPARLARLQAADIPMSADLPRGLDRKSNALLEAPEGTLLLLLAQES